MTLTEFLKKAGISTETIEHARVTTVEQMRALNLPVKAAKNLFLKDRKKRLWLVCTMPNAHIDLKQLGQTLKTLDLRFAKPEALREHLGVEPGSVTLFSLINDPDHQVTVVIDKPLYKQSRIGFHPLRNDATTILATKDIPRFLKRWGGRYEEVSFD